MTENTKYGDENSGYSVLAKNMSPKDARQVLQSNINDGIYKSMPKFRRDALTKKMNEEGLILDFDCENIRGLGFH